VQGSSSHHSIDDFELADHTIEELFGQLKELDLLTGKAEKEAKVTLRITVFEKVCTYNLIHHGVLK
jgi:ferredoxin-fold anticodon binding domain-containing protein